MSPATLRLHDARDAPGNPGAVAMLTGLMASVGVASRREGTSIVFTGPSDTIAALRASLCRIGAEPIEEPHDAAESARDHGEFDVPLGTMVARVDVVLALLDERDRLAARVVAGDHLASAVRAFFRPSREHGAADPIDAMDEALSAYDAATKEPR